MGVAQQLNRLIRSSVWTYRRVPVIFFTNYTCIGYAVTSCVCHCEEVLNLVLPNGRLEGRRSNPLPDTIPAPYRVVNRSPDNLLLKRHSQLDWESRTLFAPPPIHSLLLNHLLRRINNQETEVLHFHHGAPQRSRCIWLVYKFYF
jgi:hypothetical protein